MNGERLTINVVFVRVESGVGMFEPQEDPLSTAHIALAARFEFPLHLRVVAGL